MAMQVGESGTFTLSGNELVLTNASDTLHVADDVRRR